MKKIALLGSTGSIGRQVLDIVERYPDKYRVVSLCCNQSAELLQTQIEKFKPTVAGLTQPDAARLIKRLPSTTTLYTGENALLHCVTEDADVVFVATVGFCGIYAVIRALEMGKTVALANKEALVAGGEIVMPLIKKHGGKIIPVDSEHSAIWQALGCDEQRPFKKIILTASGGALRSLDVSELKSVTPKQALAHPNWQMGAKITIDCATMLNKGLEVIEAKWLFNCSLDKIEVVIHPQSIIHSMVEYADNAVIAQLGLPSMEVPIQFALSYPERMPTTVKSVDFTKTQLTFAPVDMQRYPCFKLALESASEGGVFPCALSGANEEAVRLFLNGLIPFTSISKYVQHALECANAHEVTIDNLTVADRNARIAVLSAFKEKKIDL